MLDCGVKVNMIRELVKLNCSVTVFPATTSFKDIQNHQDGFDALFLSNGPGNPSQVPEETINTIREWVSTELNKNKYDSVLRPVFGVCMGNQLLGYII